VTLSWSFGKSHAAGRSPDKARPLADWGTPLNLDGFVFLEGFKIV
jgi:hypothetical protein